MDTELVMKLARLAALHPTGDEAAQMVRELEATIALIDEMQAVDTTGIEPLAHPLDTVAPLRGDVVTEQVDRDKYQASAPETRDGLYLVPRVVE